MQRILISCKVDLLFFFYGLFPMILEAFAAGFTIIYMQSMYDGLYEWGD